jgi:hypothetical protein
MPLTVLVALGLDMRVRHRLFEGVLSIGAVLAMVSLVRFLAWGERAHLPLVDPNNYATLMYLLWIPFVHERLVGRWRGEQRHGLFSRLIEGGLSFLLLSAAFATHSRTGAAVVVAALGIWIVTALLRRIRGRLLRIAAGAR